MRVNSTNVTNLVRAEESGVYYARAKIRGKILWRSLDTTTFTVAKLRLPDELKELRDAAPVAVKLEPKLSFRDAVQLYKLQVNENARLKPRGLILSALRKGSSKSLENDAF